MKTRIFILTATLAIVAGCGAKTEAPKVDAAKQQADALEEARKGAFGTQVKALDKAKGLQEELNKKAIENVDKAEKDAAK
jgi:hypothetical protein